MSGVKWLALTKIIIQIFRWGSTFWVIRQLNANDYGIIAIVEIMVSILVAVNYLCIGNVIIRYKTISKVTMDTLFTFSLLIGLILFSIQFLAAPYFASFYDTPEAENVLRILAIAYILESFNVRPFAMLAKTLKFKILAKIDLVAGILTPFSTIIAVSFGAGYWALAIGLIMHTLVRFFMVNYYLSYKIVIGRRFNRTMKLMKFGIQNAMSSVISQVNSSLDFIIGGALFTTGALGIYQVGLQIAFIPLRKITPELRRLAFPAFCKVSHDLKLVKSYYSKVNRIVAYLAFPLFWGLGYLAEEIVSLLLTNKWLESAIIIQVLCWFLPFRLLSEINGVVLNSKGRSDLLLKNNVISAIAFLISIYIFMGFDIKGLAFAWCVSISISFLILCWDIKSVLKFSTYGMLKVYLPQLFSSLIMLTGLYILNQTIALNGVLFLAVNILVGGIVYLASVYLMDKPIYKEIQLLLKSS
ncbi:MAG: lipopolysaccharide biosynthesis protein [Colwellia sp.]|nr:lipopolysaccharide biosynthesis protein [Colwellia sp.]